MAQLLDDQKQMVLLAKCYDFAARKHKDQRRLDPSKTPYINHPIGITLHLNLKTTNSDIEKNLILKV